MPTTTSRLRSQGPGRPPCTPIRSGWPGWVGPAAAVWSLGCGLLGLWWTFGGAGFPFGTEHDPHAAKVSILEHVQQDAAAPVIAALGLGGVALAMVLARRRTRGPLGAALLGFAWTVAVALAVVIPDVRPLTAVTRWAWALGIPLGVTREFLREEARETPDIWLAGAALATVAVGGATLSLGLVQRWGEVYPGWIPVVGGKPVRPRTAIIPASLVAVLMTSAGLGHYRAAILGYFPPGSTGENWGTVAPGYLWPLWGVALAAATYAYYLRRRGRCPYCGRS